MKYLHQTKRFDVTVGIPPGEDFKFEVYLVTNRETGVVEFAHNVLHFVREWCDEMDNQMDVWEAKDGHPGQTENVAIKSYN